MPPKNFTDLSSKMQCNSVFFFFFVSTKYCKNENVHSMNSYIKLGLGMLNFTLVININLWTEK